MRFNDTTLIHTYNSQMVVRVISVIYFIWKQRSRSLGHKINEYMARDEGENNNVEN